MSEFASKHRQSAVRKVANGAAVVRRAWLAGSAALGHVSRRTSYLGGFACLNWTGTFASEGRPRRQIFSSCCLSTFGHGKVGCDVDLVPARPGFGGKSAAIARQNSMFVASMIGWEAVSVSQRCEVVRLLCSKAREVGCLSRQLLR